MPRIVVEAAILFSQRAEQIRAIIGSIAADSAGVQIRFQKHEKGYIVSVSDGFDQSESPQDRLFRTECPEVFAQYYEIWTPLAKGRTLHLFQNYFHLYALPAKRVRDQLFCLHTEPEESLDNMVGRVKATPHIHVKCKEERLLPLAKAHLPICYSIVENALSSVTAFDQIFREALSIIKHEVVDRFATA